MSPRTRPQAIVDSQKRLELLRLLEVVAGYAESSPGRQAVLTLEPAGERGAIEERLAEVEEMSVLVAEGYPLRLAALREVTPLLLESAGPLATRALTGLELSALAAQLERGFALATFLRERVDLPHLARRASAMPDLPGLRDILERSIDAQGEVLDGASAELHGVRERIQAQERALRTWMERHRDSPALRGAMQGNVISVRNGRFVFAVRAEHRHLLRGVVHGESSTGATLFIEPQEIVREGDELEALRMRERREVTRILLELTRAAREERHALAAIERQLVHMDARAACARYGRAFGCRRPRLSAERELRLSDARHPLLLWRERGAGENGVVDLEGARARVHPLRLELNAAHYQMVVTGPNTGGKTVVLKAVGLLTLMTYAGIPIPAGEDTSIPLFDAVLADIGDEQSIEQNLSTFSAHVGVQAAVLSSATSRSLVLIDELGAGTDPLEGAAIGEAVLDALYVRGAFTIVTTHIGRLKEYAFRKKKCLNASMQFDPERLVPTYELVLGVPGRSNATIIARRLGLPEEVVAQAETILTGDERLDPAVLEGLERTRLDLERQRGEMERHRRQAHDLERAALGELETLRAQKSAVEHEAEQAEEARVRALMERMSGLLDAMGEPPRERKPAFDELRRALAEAVRATPLAARRLARAEALRKGDAVFIPRFKQVCEVKKINKAKEILTVSLNGIPTEVSFLDISWILPPPGYQLEWYESK